MKEVEWIWWILNPEGGSGMINGGTKKQWNGTI
jgi:hypothetical protein